MTNRKKAQQDANRFSEMYYKPLKRIAAIQELRSEIYDSFKQNPDFSSLYKTWLSSLEEKVNVKRIVLIVLAQFLLFFIMTLLNKILFLLAVTSVFIYFWFAPKIREFTFNQNMMKVLPTIVSGYFCLIYGSAAALLVGELVIELFSSNTTVSDSLFLSKQTSVADLLHFSVVTVSTLGYGDIVPIHWLSKLICSWLAIAGVLYIAFSIVIIAAIILDQSERRKLTQTLVNSVITDALEVVYKNHEEIIRPAFSRREITAVYLERELWSYIRSLIAKEDM